MDQHTALDDIDGRSVQALHDNTLAGWLAEQECPGAFENGDLWTWLQHYSRTLGWLDDALHVRRAELALVGVSPEDFVRLVVDARMSEPEADMENLGRIGEIISPPAKVCIRRLTRAGLEPKLIADLINVPVSYIERYNRQHQKSGSAETVGEVLTLHLAGKTPLTIANDLGVSRSWVYQILEEHAYRPNRERTDPISESDRRKVLRLFRGGLRGVELVRESGVDKPRVYRVLRKAHQDGSLPEYAAVAS